MCGNEEEVQASLVSGVPLTELTKNTSPGLFFLMKLRLMGVEHKSMEKPLSESFLASSRKGVMWP